MTRHSSNRGVAIIGTRARGGIRAVIENHQQAGVYDGYTTYCITSHDEAGIGKRILLALGALLTLLRLLIARRVSICHLHGSFLGSIYRKALFIFVCRLFGCKVIFHLHGSEFARTYGDAGPLYRRVVRYVLDRSDGVFVLSRYWQEFVESISSNPQIRVINNFPSPEFEDLYASRDFRDNARKELLFLGYIGQRKGIYDLVDAVELLLSREVSNFRITVGGNGEVDQLRRLVTTRGLDDYFNIIGWVSGEQKRTLLKRSQLLLLPSHNEGLPIAILEALSAGLAVVSTRVGGIPDAIRDERYGLLVDPGQPAQLADAMARYLTQDSLIEKVRRNARQLYDAVYSAQANVKLIRQVLGGLV
jgi:glycosyltransferase involved in cell wall biosynthesis